MRSRWQQARDRDTVAALVPTAARRAHARPELGLGLGDRGEVLGVADGRRDAAVGVFARQPPIPALLERLGLSGEEGRARLADRALAPEQGLVAAVRREVAVCEVDRLIARRARDADEALGDAPQSVMAFSQVPCSKFGQVLGQPTAPGVSSSVVSSLADVVGTAAALADRTVDLVRRLGDRRGRRRVGARSGSDP